ncbi:class I SAM-dependent methyltransferase [Synechocystis sp. PCC 7509]|uniref:class I SAM-dependent methyltransferase n=1 Tax=Synechocystis sp. PCC 7509 TaxID=927677 RepID=UPI0002ABA88F|nr:class I SAM-dependent methyltransferase [Synechocystis sp. PCC 7509]
MTTPLMKQMWNQRAKKDAFYYVESAFWDGDVEKFFLLGEERTQLILDPMLKDMNVDIQKSHILEIGCGLGRFSRQLSQRFQQVTAVDVSDEMINQARELHPSNLYPNLHLQSTNGTSLDFILSSSIDFVFSYEVFQHMPSPEIILNNLKEIHRVLRPQGIAYIHLMNDQGKLKKAIKKFIKHLTPQKFLQTFGFAPFTFDPTWTGTSLSTKQIQEFCKLTNLKLINLMDDPTHGSGDRVFLLASSVD